MLEVCGGNVLGSLQHFMFHLLIKAIRHRCIKIDLADDSAISNDWNAQLRTAGAVAGDVILHGVDIGDPLRLCSAVGQSAHPA